MPKKRKGVTLTKVTKNDDLLKEINVAMCILSALAVVAIVLHIVLVQTQMGIRNIVHFYTAADVATWRGWAIFVHISFVVISLLSTAFALYIVDDAESPTTYKSVPRPAQHRKLKWARIPQVIWAVACISILISMTLWCDGGRNANELGVVLFHIWRSFFWLIPIVHWILVGVTIERKLCKFFNRIRGRRKGKRSRRTSSND